MENPCLPPNWSPGQLLLSSAWRWLADHGGHQQTWGLQNKVFDVNYWIMFSKARHVLSKANNTSSIRLNCDHPRNPRRAFIRHWTKENAYVTLHYCTVTEHIDTDTISRNKLNGKTNSRKKNNNSGKTPRGKCKKSYESATIYRRVQVIRIKVNLNSNNCG